MPSLPPYNSLRTICLFSCILPTIFSSIFLSLVWGIGTHLKHGPWLHIFRSHVIWPLISFHHSFHPLTHIAFPPFTMPWLSLVIGPNPFYPTFIHITFDLILPLTSIKFIYPLIQSIFSSSNSFTSNQFYSHYSSSYQHHSSNLIHIHSSICISISSIHPTLHKIKNIKKSQSLCNQY